MLAKIYSFQGATCTCSALVSQILARGVRVVIMVCLAHPVVSTSFPDSRALVSSAATHRRPPTHSHRRLIVVTKVRRAKREVLMACDEETMFSARGTNL